MLIRIDAHTIEQMKKRGTNEREIREVLETEIEYEAKLGRKKKSKVFPFQNIWEGKFYEQKKVEVIYFVENNLIITVTVYVYYGKWQ